MRGRRICAVAPAAVVCSVLFSFAGLLSSWFMWNRPANALTFKYYLSGLVSGPFAPWPAIVLVGASVIAALAFSLSPRRLVEGRRIGGGNRGGGTLVFFSLISLLLVASLAGNIFVWASLGKAAGTVPLGGGGEAAPVPCGQWILQEGPTPVSFSVATGMRVVGTPGQDFGEFVSGVIASHTVVCFEPGDYILTSQIRVFDKNDVTLWLPPAASLSTYSPVRLLQIARSSDIAVIGGRWIGPGFGDLPDIEVDLGSTGVTVEGTDVTGAGHDGILVRNDTTLDSRISILNNILHGNGRYGVQDYQATPESAKEVLISGNRAEDNAAGGIYTNGVGGVRVIDNVVKNTAGNLPGLIGIGVTLGHDGAVVGNRVEHMHWYGIQIFYNNDTLVYGNYASFNAGDWDESGITNDHSSFDTITNNTVESNGRDGIHVERSWFVTVKENTAERNGQFGIEFYHGDMQSTAKGMVYGNICSFNGQGGIILNSGQDFVLMHNTCLDNSGAGILLYNDPGYAGSSGNTVSDNTCGDDRVIPSERTQAYGIRELNQADGNTIISNVAFNDTVANIAAVGPNTREAGNMESPQGGSAGTEMAAAVEPSVPLGPGMD